MTLKGLHGTVLYMDPEDTPPEDTPPEDTPPETKGASVHWEHLDYNTHEEREIDFFDRED